MNLRRLSVVFFGLLLAACGDSPRAGDEGLRRPGGKNSSCALALPATDLCASVSWDKKPEAEQVTSAHIRFSRRSDGVAADPLALHYSVALTMRMPGHPHGGPATRTTRDATGAYLVEGVDFFMPGHWELTIELHDAAGTIRDKTSFSVFL